VVTSASLRVVFFGTPSFARPTLDALLASRHQVVAVVTQPDRPSGRGQKTSDSPVKARAREAGVPILQPATLKGPEFPAILQQFAADLGVVAAYGKILPEAVIEVPRLGMINVHASLLPRYRGAAPVHRAVMAGEVETGVTIMRVVKALDAGPMLATSRRPIHLFETSHDIEVDLARMGASLLMDTVDRMAAGGVPEAAQNDADATFAPRLTKEEGAIDWSRSARDIHNLIRGLHPWPHAFTFFSGNRLILLRSRPVTRSSDADPGAVVVADGDDLQVATGDGVLQILELQPEGRRRMSPREWLAGHRVGVGHRFAPPR
jgi:methionyl-tRNA formyltransferase